MDLMKSGLVKSGPVGNRRTTVNVPQVNTQVEADLICEALVREIGRGPRWQAVREAWAALLVVRRMSEDMQAERVHLAGASGVGTDARSLGGSPR